MTRHPSSLDNIGDSVAYSPGICQTNASRVSEKIAGSLVAVKAIYGWFTEAFFINKTYIMRTSAFYIMDLPFFADIIVLLRTSSNIDSESTKKFVCSMFFLFRYVSFYIECFCFGVFWVKNISGIDMNVFSPL